MSQEDRAMRANVADGQQPHPRPTTDQLRQELALARKKDRYVRTLLSTISILVVVAAGAVLISTLMMPALQVTGTSMEPTLENDDIVLARRGASYNRGDVVAFYYNNKVLLKRVIGLPGDQIYIDEDGTVTVNGNKLDEPYLTEKSLGECDIDFPYQVPDGKLFVLGDHRSTSVDSRSKTVGCISTDMVVGTLVFRVYPFKSFGRFRTLGPRIASES